MHSFRKKNKCDWRKRGRPPSAMEILQELGWRTRRLQWKSYKSSRMTCRLHAISKTIQPLIALSLQSVLVAKGDWCGVKIHPRARAPRHGASPASRRRLDSSSPTSPGTHVYYRWPSHVFIPLKIREADYVEHTHIAAARLPYPLAAPLRVYRAHHQPPELFPPKHIALIHKKNVAITSLIAIDYRTIS